MFVFTPGRERPSNWPDKSPEPAKDSARSVDSMLRALKVCVKDQTGPFTLFINGKATPREWLDDNTTQVLFRRLCQDDFGANFSDVTIKFTPVSDGTLRHVLRYCRKTPDCTTLRVVTPTLKFQNAGKLGESVALSNLQILQFHMPFDFGGPPVGLLRPSKGCDSFLDAFLNTLAAEERIHPLRELHIATNSLGRIVRLLTSPHLPHLRILKISGYKGDRSLIIAGVKEHESLVRLDLDWGMRPTTTLQDGEGQMYADLDANMEAEKRMFREFSSAIVPARILARSTPVSSESKNLTNLANMPTEIKVCIIKHCVPSQPLCTYRAHRLLEFGEKKDGVFEAPVGVMPNAEGPLPHGLADWCWSVLSYQDEAVDEVSSESGEE